MSPQEQETVMMDMWEVPAGRQQEVIDGLRELLEPATTDGRVR
jgi:hypothetical protein